MTAKIEAVNHALISSREPCTIFFEMLMICWGDAGVKYGIGESYSHLLEGVIGWKANTKSIGLAFVHRTGWADDIPYPMLQVASMWSCKVSI